MDLVQIKWYRLLVVQVSDSNCLNSDQTTVQAFSGSVATPEPVATFSDSSTGHARLDHWTTARGQYSRPEIEAFYWRGWSGRHWAQHASSHYGSGSILTARVCALICVVE